MALEDMIGDLYKYNMALPLQYASPYFNYLGNQAQNMAGVGNAYQSNVGALGNQYQQGVSSLGNTYQGNIGSIGTNSLNQAGQLGSSAMNLYGGLANTQASMYNSELPVRAEMAKYNALAPALSGLLGQFGGGAGISLGQMDMNFQRPDVMSGYQGAVDNSYNQLGNFTNNAYSQSGNAYTGAMANANSAYNSAQKNAGSAYGTAAGGVQGYDNEFKNQWTAASNRAMPGFAASASPSQKPRFDFAANGMTDGLQGALSGLTATDGADPRGSRHEAPAIPRRVLADYRNPSGSGRGSPAGMSRPWQPRAM